MVGVVEVAIPVEVAVVADRGGHCAQTTLSCFLLAGPGRLLSWETPVSRQPVPVIAV